MQKILKMQIHSFRFFFLSLFFPVRAFAAALDAFRGLWSLRLTCFFVGGLLCLLDRCPRAWFRLTCCWLCVRFVPFSVLGLLLALCWADPSGLLLALRWAVCCWLCVRSISLVCCWFCDRPFVWFVVSSACDRSLLFAVGCAFGRFLFCAWFVVGPAFDRSLLFAVGSVFGRFHFCAWFVVGSAFDVPSVFCWLCVDRFVFGSTLDRSILFAVGSVFDRLLGLLWALRWISLVCCWLCVRPFAWFVFGSADPSCLLLALRAIDPSTFDRFLCCVWFVFGSAFWRFLFLCLVCLALRAIDPSSVLGW